MKQNVLGVVTSDRNTLDVDGADGQVVHAAGNMVHGEVRGDEDFQVDMEPAKNEEVLPFASGGGKDIADGNLGQDGRKDNVVENSVYPYLARGPLLEKAINEFKKIKGSMKKKGTDGISLENTTKPFSLTRDLSTPLRRSLRRARSVDEDSLGQASLLVAKRNLEASKGNTYENS